MAKNRTPETCGQEIRAPATGGFFSRTLVPFLRLTKLDCMKGIRVSAKAVIIRDGKLLVTVNDDIQGEFRLLPGGGQDPGEPLTEALRRECREEMDVEIDVGDIVFTRDYIGSRHEFANRQSDVHQLEIMFSCGLPAGEEPAMTDSADDFQTGVEWCPLENLERLRFYPAALIPHLRDFAADRNHPNYIGAVN